jgi:tetratricopeptide (TPR) repeat protein
MAQTNHLYSGANMGAVMYGLTEGVDLNNQACQLQNMGRYQEAIALFKRALEIKKEAHGLYSVNYCISLSGLADCLMYSGDLDGAYAKARLMLDIATEIQSAEQGRIAKEILKDISVKTKKPLLPDEKQGPLSKSSKKSTAHQTGDGSHIWIEPPVKRCHNFSNPAQMCSNVENLKQCGRCKTVYYCSRECQLVSPNFEQAHVTCFYYFITHYTGGLESSQEELPRCCLSNTNEQCM